MTLRELKSKWNHCARGDIRVESLCAMSNPSEIIPRKAKFE